MSDLALRTLRDDVVKARDETLKFAAGMKRRAESARRRNDASEDAQELQQFKLGLANECPLCGVSYKELKDSGISCAEHMLNCNDTEKLQKRKREKQEMRDKKAKREEGEAKQDKAAALASWQFLGSKDEQLYLLGEDELEKVASDRGISTTSKSKSDVIAAIVSGKSTSLVRHDGSPSSSIRKETLPSIETLQRLDLEELRCILAAHGVVGIDGKTKAQLLRMVEGAILNDDDEKGRSGVMLLENGKNEREEGSSEDEDDDDDEYNEVEVIDLT